MRKNINSLETDRKFREYDMKVTKIAGYLSDYYIDRAIESEDFSDVSGFLIEKFYNSDIVYLLSKYKEFELDKQEELRRDREDIEQERRRYGSKDVD